MHNNALLRTMMHLCKKDVWKRFLLYSNLYKNGFIENFDIDGWTETDVYYTTCMDVTKKGCQWVLQIYLAYWASAWHALVPDTHLVKIKAQKNNRPVSKQYGYFLTKLWGANRLSVTPFLIVILSHCLPYVNFPAKVFRYTNAMRSQLIQLCNISEKENDWFGILLICDWDICT